MFISSRQFTLPESISNLHKELFMRSENTRELASESKDHSLWFINEIQLGIINLIKNHNQHLSRILPLLRFTAYDYLKWYSSHSCLLHFVIRYPYLRNNSSSMDFSHTLNSMDSSHILNSGNLKIFVCQAVIFSQNYEFSQLCVPSIYLPSLHFGNGE